tara:strand:- start:1884 stop:2855 length:972 start_codon:yes stop_codon:yes gene_type:complete
MSAFTEKNTLMGSAGGVSGSRGVSFGGEVPSVGLQNVIQYVEISSAGDAADFGDMLSINGYSGASSNGATDRGLCNGGNQASYRDTIQYVTISTPGNSTDFGDLTLARWYTASCSNGTDDRSLTAGGDKGPPDHYTDIIDYVTISSAGNATDFGDLNAALKTGNASFSNGTDDRGVFGAGWTPSTYTDMIAYVTITSTGNTTDFGDLTLTRRSASGVSNDTEGRGVFAGGTNSSGTKVNTMDYITIASTGNATDFGDLLAILSPNTASGAGSGADQRGVFFGGNGASAAVDTIQYITINSAGNATDFGDLLAAASGAASCSNA